MELNRRQFVNLATGSVATCLLGGIVPIVGNSDPPIKAIAFDGFTTFDPRSVFALAEQLFPGRGPELSTAWRARQFEYTWLRTVCGHYADFWRVTEDALVFATNILKLELSLEKRQRLMQAYLELKSFPDALPALKSLRAAGIRLAFLSNLTSYMLDSAIKSSGLEGIFEPSLSTDRVRVYKPDPRTYRPCRTSDFAKASSDKSKGILRPGFWQVSP